MDKTKNEKYQVILINQLANGQTMENAIIKLSELFKKNKTFVEKMLCQQTFIVKSNASKEQATEMQQRIKKTGIECLIKKIQMVDSSTNLSQTYNTLIICPKCETQQKVSESCINCGIFFKKYNQNPNNAISNAIKPTQSNLYQSRHKTNKESGNRWYKNKLLVMVFIAVSIGILFTNMQSFEKRVIDPSKVGIKIYEIEEVRFVDDLVEPGYVTTIIFYADWCDSCVKHENTERLAMQRHPDIAIRRINMSRSNGFQIVQNKYKLPIYHVPFTIIYDEDGDIIAEDKAKHITKNYYAGTNYFRNNFANK